MKCVTILACLGLLAVPAMSGRLDPTLQGATGARRVIVSFKKSPTPQQHDRIKSRGGRLHRNLDSVAGAAYDVPADQLQALAADADVESVQPDREVRSTDFNGTLDYGWMTVWRAATKNASLPYTGAGIGVAVLDSGAISSPELGTRLVYKENFVPGETTPWDLNGHGAHVMGIVANSGANSKGSGFSYTVKGVAPGAKIISLRVLNAQGVGNDSAVIAAIDRAIALKSTYNIRVMNLSLGRPVTGSYTNDLLCKAVEKAWNAGIVVVVAAGNEGRNNANGTQGYGMITSPGNHPAVITVGAINTYGTLDRADDRMTSYSSKGPTLIDHVVKPDLVAPGNGIISNRLYETAASLMTLYPRNLVPTAIYATGSTYQEDYYQLSGTSMAAPMVAGAAAVLLQKTPSLTPNQVKARLMKTAWKGLPSVSTAIDPVSGASYTMRRDIFTVGAGYLDLNAALADTSLSSRSAASPTVSFNSVTKTITLNVAGANLVWGENIVWGTNLVWGEALVSATNLVWGENVVWGTGGATAGTNIIWGEGSTAANNIIWGESTQGRVDGLDVALGGDR